MRKRGRTDSNQQAIVAALRKAGCSVQSLANIGNGCPDLLVAHLGENILLEVKDGNAPPSKRKLTTDEEDWHNAWQGQVDIVGSVKEALRIVGLAK